MVEQQQIGQMTEEELRAELTESLVALSTTSGDKRANFAIMFNVLGKEEDTHKAGVNFYFADIGQFGLVPQETDEDSGKYQDNLIGKSHRFLAELANKENKIKMRSAMRVDGKGNEFDYEAVNIIGMTEDSGWEVIFANDEQKQKFLTKARELLKPYIREGEEYLLKDLETNGFPGPNLKPLQEHLTGKFDGMMDVIYQAAEAANIEDIRFKQTRTVSFASPRLNKTFEKSFSHEGGILSREEYQKRMASANPLETRNSNFVQVVEGQNKTLDLIEGDLLTKSSEDFSGDFAMRKMGEWLQDLVGKRRSSKKERKRNLNVATITPEDIFGGEENSNQTFAIPRDLRDLSYGTKIPDNEYLLQHTHATETGDANVVVLLPTQVEKNNELKADPNLRLLLRFAVGADTSAKAMGVPIILDNRTGGFNDSLKVITESYNGGKTPFRIASSHTEMERHLREVKDILQRAPIIETIDIYRAESKQIDPLPQLVPDDGVFTVFIAGGHANNGAQDIEEAIALGKMCAENGWRIITGAGILKGSMGAVHTGFIQHFLDKIDGSSLDEYMRNRLEPFRKDNTYDAEAMIKKDPKLVDILADKGMINRDLFYGYSMEDMLKMEGNGKPTPGITYVDAGNRTRRLHALLSSGNKVYMPGGPGTLEEFEEDLAKHLAARKDKDGTKVYADGMPNNDAVMMVYNRDGVFTALLQEKGLFGDSAEAKAKRALHGIIVVDRFNGEEPSKKNVKSELASLAETRKKDRDSNPTVAV
jgi:hypothetical protein